MASEGFSAVSVSWGVPLKSAVVGLAIEPVADQLNRRWKMSESKHAPNTILLAIAGAIALLMASSPAAAKSERRIAMVEDNLAAAGFVVKPANTPERIDMLTRLPANKFVQRVNGDIVTYVYADPRVCACLYVGTQDAYGQYQRDMQTRRLADQQTLAAQAYDDARWNWGSWGPWGSYWGFGPHGW